MALDIQAKLAELRAKKAAESAAIKGNMQNVEEKNSIAAGMVTVSSSPILSSGSSNITLPVTSVVSGTSSISAGTFAPAILGTAKTSEIDHLEFLSKLNSLQDAMLKQHPTMPVLLMQIHKQLMVDPELVTVLNEEAIGLIVRGLQQQTKTELVQVTLKSAASSSKKKIPLSVDMF